MAKREEVLAKHPYKISQTKDGQWTTHYIDGGVRKQIKRKSRKDIEDELLKHYETIEDNPTLDEIFQKVQSDKLAFDHKKEATISRNQREYQRFFSTFGKRRIKSIDELEVEQFLRNCRREKDLSRKAFNYLTALTRMIFNEAWFERYVTFDIDPVIKRSRGQQRTSFRDTRKEYSKEVYTGMEFTRLEQKLWQDGGIHSLGVLMLMYTGMRIGEAVSLTWDDYDPEHRSLHVHRTETTYSDEDGKLRVKVSDSPKTDAGNRFIPVLPELKEVLDRIKKLEPDAEYILSYRGVRIRAEKIRRKLRNICDSCGLEYRSPHKLRKTFASRLAAEGIPSQIIIDLLGHEDYEVTQRYYIKQYASLEQKEQYMKNVFGKATKTLSS